MPGHDRDSICSRETLDRIWRRYARTAHQRAFGDEVTRRFSWTTCDILLRPDFTETEPEELHHLAGELLNCAEDAESHMSALNQKMAGFVMCSYAVSSPTTVNKAHDLLSRMPRYPIEILSQALVSANYYLPHGLGWTQLRVVSLLDACTMRLALAVVDVLPGEAIPSLGFAIRAYLDRLVRLMDVVGEDESARKHSTANAIVQVYLWCMWQRSIVVFFSFVLRYELTAGQANADMVALTFPKLMSRMLKSDASLSPSSPYMCRWALKLLKASRVSQALDFRRFYQSFAAAHHAALGRCTTDSRVCSGTSPESCGRFNDRALVRPEQSQHDESCDGGCDRLIWDAQSYAGVKNGRAVDIVQSGSTVQYCQAGGQTLAISHVWSHGQGGRPSTGINTCLHRRYVDLATQHGCTSYWIDTMCIPEERGLRKEAISYINSTFSNSLITVVCDRDIASLPVPASDNIPAAERLLSTLLICDWNVRAWTLLEAVRGRKNLHVLCKGNQLVSVKQLLLQVLDHGAVDIANIALGCQQLLSYSTNFNVAEGSAVLSHRYATRPGDDVVIWSLLCPLGKPPTGDGVDFWRARIGAAVNTAFLLSSAPRIQNVKGLSWAPQTPNARVTALPPDAAFSSADGNGSFVGKIVARGLAATWLVYVFHSADGNRFARGEGGVMNPCWSKMEKLQASHARVAFLMAKSLVGWHRFRIEGQTRPGHPVALVWSNSTEEVWSVDYEDQWTWSSVGEWPQEVALPEMEGPLPEMSPVKILLL